MFPAKVYLLIPHLGSEGYGEPTAVFFEKHDAEAAEALVDAAGYSTVRIVEVPVWPHLPKGS